MAYSNNLYGLTLASLMAETWEEYEVLINTPPPLQTTPQAPLLPSLHHLQTVLKPKKKKIRYGHNTNELKCVAGSMIRKFLLQDALVRFKEETGCPGKHICTKGYEILRDISRCNADLCSGCCYFVGIVAGN